MSLDFSRLDRSYYDVETAVLQLSTQVIGSEIYNILSGNTSATVEYFADIKYGDSLIALPMVDMITIERRMGQASGTLHVGYISESFPVSGITSGSKVTVDAGIRYSGKTAIQRIFTGKMQKVTNPSPGDSQRGYFDALDAGMDLMSASPGTGYNTGLDAILLPPRISGDVSSWVISRIADIGIALRTKSESIVVPDDTLLAYRNLFDAIQAMANAYDYRYVCVTGNNDLVILDPAFIADFEPLFTLASAGISKAQKISSIINRLNRIPYQKAGTTTASYIFWVDELGVMRRAYANPVTAITGTYNDLEDQESYPILTGDTLRNDICASMDELEALAAATANETQRERNDLILSCFNPFVDLGDIVEISGAKHFVSRVRHDINAGSPWKTRIEVLAL